MCVHSGGLHRLSNPSAAGGLRTADWERGPHPPTVPPSPTEWQICRQNVGIERMYVCRTIGLQGLTPVRLSSHALAPGVRRPALSTVAMGGCYGWLLWVVAMGGCYGWLLWVVAACPCAWDADRCACNQCLDQFHGVQVSQWKTASGVIRGGEVVCCRCCLLVVAVAAAVFIWLMLSLPWCWLFCVVFGRLHPLRFFPKKNRHVFVSRHADVGTRQRKTVISGAA